ncbi:MAG: rRNA maturation RNase YbeY [Tissierellia bacterium]|nr:rRNA maturation RNase YbeY [Tissierellia bacterium]
MDNIYFEDRQDYIKLDESITQGLVEVIQTCLEVEGLDLGTEVSVSFVNNDEIKNLNRNFRGVDKETDVLSFPIEYDFHVGAMLLGDIIISIQKAIEQAQKYGHSIQRELAYLTAHSMLHLMGYDHLNDKDKAIMRKKEKEIMKRLEIFK